MKKIMLAGIMALSVMSASAQEFKDVLAKTFWEFDTTATLDAKVDLSNKLVRISKKWDNEWAGHYYVAFSKALLSYLETDPTKRDAYLDEADKEREETVSILKKETDETYVLGAMIANMRLAVDPMNRWSKYGKIFTDDLESAKDLNPDNPRMYHLRGISTYHTPKAYGGGAKAALPYFEKAATLYDKETDSDITKPSWGKRMNAFYLVKCRQEAKE
jgi:hypothetical protein